MIEKNILQEIKPTKSRRIPPHYNVMHAVAFYYYDEIATLITLLDNSDALSVGVDLKENEREEILNLQGEELWNWLLANDKEEVIKDLTYRQLTAAVLTDAAHFICESIIACGKGKTTVAFSLLRKPLKESLLLLEWMCADFDDFINKFHGETIRSYTLNRLSKEKRLELMDLTANMVNLGGVNAEFLWTIRYAKQHVNSFETLWTKATHLVTSVKASATEPGNINFIFSNPTAIEEQWDHYYNTVPFLLYYFLQVAEKVASKFIEWNSNIRLIQEQLRELAFLRFAKAKDDYDGIDEEIETLIEAFRLIKLPCEGCEKLFRLEKDDVDLLWLKEKYFCPTCGQSYNIWETILKSES